MDKLRRFYSEVGFTGSNLEVIINAYTVKQYRKNEFFIEMGKTSSYLGYIDKGMFQYYVLKDGEERTTYVSIEDTFLASLLSFVGELPSLENVKALTDSRVYLISKTNLKKLVNELPGFKDFYIGLLEESICGIDSSRHDLIVLNGDQRYFKMLLNEPHFLQQIPLQYLASMLGVTPRHLSRIRNKPR